MHADRVPPTRQERVTPETGITLKFFLMALSAWAFLKLSSKVRRGSADEIDKSLLKAFRQKEDAAVPIGPSWVLGVAHDLTALGSGTNLFCFSAIVVGFLCLNRRIRAAGFVIAALGSGLLICQLLKDFFLRTRPNVVPKLTRFDAKSFPSGHSMGSALVYLTLGSIISRQSRRFTAKIYFLSVGLVLAILVGISRVYLGVHYPSDVLAGWMAGSLWSSACAEMARWLQRRGSIEPSGGVTLPSAEYVSLNH